MLPLIYSASCYARSGRALIYTIFLIWHTPSLFGQEVQDSSYAVMLNGLLSRQVAEMDVEKASTLGNAVFLDAREWEEYQVSHLPGALWVGYEDFQIDRLKELTKDTTIVVYCSVGYRSERITKRIANAGFEAVFNLYGGIFEWVNRDFPVVDEQGTTSKVHAYDRFWGIWLTSGEKVY